MKLLIIGHARHGKDTVCEILNRNHGLSWQSSSEAACELVVYPALKTSHGYATIKDCFNDRANHRELWHHLIWQHNRHDPTRLARQIYASSDIYCGMRHATELAATRAAGLFDFCVWVDRSAHQQPEPTSSCGVTRNDAEYLLDNNGTLADLERNIGNMMETFQSVLDQNSAWKESQCPRCHGTGQELIHDSLAVGDRIETCLCRIMGDAV